MKLVISALALMVGATAATPSIAADPPARTAADPNERICESIPVIGSRLAKKRVCLTRAEWDQKRRLDRQEVERAQLGPCMLQRNGADGKPAC